MYRPRMVWVPVIATFIIKEIGIYLIQVERRVLKYNYLLN